MHREPGRRKIDNAAGGRDDAGAPGRENLVVGRNPVFEALRANRPIHRLWLQAGRREGSIRQIEALARQKGVVVLTAETERLDAMAGGARHQGVVAVAAEKEVVSLADVVEGAARRGEPLLAVVADGIEDPHNLGSIIRTVEAVGGHGVIIPKRRSAGLTPVVSKASSGALEYVPVARAANLSEAIRSLKRAGAWVVGADAEAGAEYTAHDFTKPTALVIGGEGEGLSRLVRENCDALARLPMRGRVASLNASVAAAVLLYEALRQRRLAAVEGPR